MLKEGMSKWFRAKLVISTIKIYGYLNHHRNVRNFDVLLKFENPRKATFGLLSYSNYFTP